MVLTDPGPDDRGRTAMASWKLLGDSSIDVHIEGSPTSRRMIVVECGDDILRVRLIT